MGANMSLVYEHRASNGDKIPGTVNLRFQCQKVLGSLVRKAIIKELFRLTCCAYE